LCYIDAMKTYIHARLDEDDRAMLDHLKRATGHSESELVRRGLRLIQQDVGHARSARDLAARSVGKFKDGPKDLARNRKHLEGFGR
jgi:Arc/MetJ-type ribon-helix-helix transcriptional regulator